MVGLNTKKAKEATNMAYGKKKGGGTKPPKR